MSERTTGATADQIEARMRADWDRFAKQTQTKSSQGEGYEGYVWRRRWTYVAEAGRWVDKDHRIVSVADLEALLTGYRFTFRDSDDDGLIDRIRALIGDAP